MPIVSPASITKFVNNLTEVEMKNLTGNVRNSHQDTTVVATKGVLLVTVVRTKFAKWLQTELAILLNAVMKSLSIVKAMR